MDEDIFLAGGITNLSNTCYISATFQVLFRYKPFRDLILKYAKSNPDNTLLNIMKNLIISFGDSKKPLDPTPLVEFYGIDKTKQQDAGEFMTHLLNDVIETLPNDENNEFRKLLTVKVEYTTRPGFDSLIFYTIPVLEGVPVKDAFNISLDDSQTFITTPKFFFIQIQRMQFDISTKTLEKKNDSMEIPFDLDLKKWKNPNYSLFAVIQHIGSGQGGHYRVCLKDAEGWVMASDSRVYPISERKCLETSTSTDSPAYILAFVTDTSDIITLRKQIFDNFPTERYKKSTEIIAKRTSCAFKRPSNITKSDTVVCPIKIVIQYFDQKTMEFKDPDEMEFHSLDDAMAHLQLVSMDSTLTVLYGYTGYFLDPKIPEDFGYYDTPLYLILQNNDYRIFDRIPNHKIINVNIEFGTIRFPMCFFSDQQVADAIRYGKRIIKEKFNFESNLEPMFRIHNNLISTNKTIMFKSLINFQNAEISICFVEKSRISQKIHLIPVYLYKEANPTKIAGDISFEVKLQPDLDSIKASASRFIDIDQSGLFAVPKRGNEIVELTEPLNPFIMYDPDYELWMFDSCSNGVSLVVFDRMRFLVQLQSDFESFAEDLAELLRAKPIQILFRYDNHVINKITDPIQMKKDHPNGYFTVTSIIE